MSNLLARTRPIRHALALATALGSPLLAQTPSAKPSVAILYFTNAALVDAAAYAPLSKGLAEMLITELGQNTAIDVVERDRLQAVIEEQNLQKTDRVDQATAIKLGKTLGARHLLMGSFVIDPARNMRIDVRAVNTQTSRIDYVESISGKADKLLELVIALGAKVNSGLKLPAWSGVSSNTPAAKSPNQFKALMAMSLALEAEDSHDKPAAVRQYREAIALAPDFSRAKVRLASLETAAR
jgi:curli biogenesis system outer membrane secretion channel CsgG